MLVHLYHAIGTAFEVLNTHHKRNKVDLSKKPFLSNILKQLQKFKHKQKKHQEHTKMHSKSNSTSSATTTASQSSLNKVRVTVVGDGGIGKSALLCMYLFNQFDFKKYDPTLEDEYSDITKDVHGEKISVTYTDTGK